MGSDVTQGLPFPLGATVEGNGVNFSVFSHNAEHVELLFFDDVDATRPSRIIALHPRRHRTYFYWHVHVAGIGPGQLYAYRAHGPRAPHEGLRFDGAKILLDPYTRCVAVPRAYDRTAAIGPGSNLGRAFLGAVVDRRGYDWEGDEPLRRPFATSVLYELHVAGFTRHPSSGVAEPWRGTYRGLIEKLPYLRELGITAVELMPVHQYDVTDAPHGLRNYWGYSPVALFAPHRGYSARQDVLGPVDEFRDMVKALHRAGIEVILDVVVNHTGEGGDDGPTLSWRGFENRDYYIVDPTDRARYLNYSGCGNTLNPNRSIVRRMILDALRAWVTEMHVDGFRFDLASVLARDDNGAPMANPPLLWDIESDPVLAGTKIIAEAWDAAGLYQVGTFVGERWAEWNGRFRDDVRRFLRGDPGLAATFAQRMAGSRDIYHRPGRDPNRGINFVTAHDGFTLVDLVSYERKHNEANLEDSLDGSNDNYSTNFGVEGPTDDPTITALRHRQIKNFLAVLLLSQGTPMLLMGDEVLRTQGGNNNPHCHDGPLTWFDWGLVDRHADVRRLVTCLIALIKEHPAYDKERFWIDPHGGRAPILTWHGTRLGAPDWAEWSHSIAFTLDDPDADTLLHVVVNAYDEPLRFELPSLLAPAVWRRVLDTARASPDDFVSAAEAPAVEEGTYLASERSVVLLSARRPGPPRP